MIIELFEHNQTAYNIANDTLDLIGKADIVHPTCTGKSMIECTYMEWEKYQEPFLFIAE